MKALCTFKDVSFQYPDGTIALQKINITIETGQKIALIGHNGAGKSTFFQHMNGLLKPTAGQVYYEGQPISYQQKGLTPIRRQVGIVFQDSESQLFAGTVRQDLAFGPLNLGWEKAVIEEAIDRVAQRMSINDLLDKPIHFLSGGQKKRVAIAGVLIMNPTMLILDEPTAGLDQYYQWQMMELLKELHEEERTIILSTHDMQLAYEWGESAIVMEKGQILFDGDADMLFSQADLMRSAHLTMPWVFDMAHVFKEKGLLQQDDYPRTREQLLSMLNCSQTIDLHSAEDSYFDK